MLAGLYNASLTDKGMNYFVRLNDIKNWSPEEQEDENDRNYKEWLSQMTDEEIQEIRAVEEYQAAESAYLDSLSEEEINKILEGVNE